MENMPGKKQEHDSLIEKEIVELIVKSLVDDPSSVKLNEIAGESSTILELHVGASEVGKVIGRHGLIAKSLRTILNAVSVKNRRKVILEILD